MNKFFFIYSFFLVGCVSRGYSELVDEVPELFPEFHAENYYKKETPKNIIYVENTLPESEKRKEEFRQFEYVERRKPESYRYYIPKDRLKAKSKNRFFEKYRRISTTHKPETQALLVE